MTTGMGWLLCAAFLVSCTYAAGALCRDGNNQYVKGTRCRHYMECENGVWLLKQCSIGQIFDPAISYCRSVSEVKCLDKTPSCEEGRVFPHAGSKSLYHLCLYGRISTRYCGAGEVFDPITQSCEVDTAPLVLRRSSGRDKRDANEACTEGTKYRDGTSCRNYKECINGKEVAKRCPDCTNYDEVSKTCRFNIAVPCGPNTYTEKPTTPTPTPTTPTPTTPTPTTPTPTTPTPRPPITTVTSSPEPQPPVTSPGSTRQPEPSSGTATEPNTGDSTPVKPKTEPTIQPEPLTERTTQPEPTTEPTTQPEPEPITEVTTTGVPCVEREKIPVKDENCKAYKECVKGVLVSKTCAWGYQFDILKKDCISSFWKQVHCDK